MTSRWSSSSMPSLLLPLLLFVTLLPSPLLALNSDGTLLLSFKYAVLNDPLFVLADWNYDDETPCSWNGVMCMGFANGTNSTTSRVISLVLPSSKLLGSVVPELGLIDHLRHLDLSGNYLNGTLPAALFNASELRILSLADNEISGDIPYLDVARLASLQVLNLSDNALTGVVPANLTLLPNLTVAGLANNYLSGALPGGGGFASLQVLDLSSNLVNGSLPPDLAGARIKYLNLSSNRLAGEIPAELGSRLPESAVLDFSFNNLTGGIPQSGAFLSQKTDAFAGNADLCGKPLKNPCTIPSTLSNPPNVTTTGGTGPQVPDSPPAFAAIPKTPEGGSPAGTAGAGSSGQGGLRPATIAAIIIGDLAGIGLLFVVFLYVYLAKKKKRLNQEQQNQQQKQVNHASKQVMRQSASPESRNRGLLWCLRNKGGDGNDTEETSETAGSSETEADDEEREKKGVEGGGVGKAQAQGKQQGATLVTVDSEVELEMETLLKASAYILGATGSSIVYKAVLADGTALAVRRIGESCSIDKLKDFEAQVRGIAKFRHPNLLRIWGFYWGPDEKLLIHDYAPNGSLGNITFSKKLGSSPFHLSWEARLRIARGVARGLAYIHEKKSVHGNLKPSNVLLGSDMEPRIGDLGLDRLFSGDGTNRPGSSARLFGSKRSMQSQSSVPELSPAPGASPVGSSSAASLPPNPYQAPESLKNLKPSAKWDVYSYGVVLLELISGRVFSEAELAQWNAGFTVEEKNKVLRMADPSMRGEVEGKEEALLSCFKVGFACASMAPQRRPSMRDVLLLLEKMPSTSSASPSFY